MDDNIRDLIRRFYELKQKHHLAPVTQPTTQPAQPTAPEHLLSDLRRSLAPSVTEIIEDYIHHWAEDIPLPPDEHGNPRVIPGRRWNGLRHPRYWYCSCDADNLFWRCGADESTLDSCRLVSNARNPDDGEDDDGLDPNDPQALDRRAAKLLRGAGPSVRTVLAHELRRLGYNGLRNPSPRWQGCSCTLDALMPCLVGGGAPYAVHCVAAIDAHRPSDA